MPGHSANTVSLNLPHEPLQGTLSPTLDSRDRWLRQGHHPELGVGRTTQCLCRARHYDVVTVTKSASLTAFLTRGQAEGPGQPALDLHSGKAGPSLGYPLGTGPRGPPRLLQDAGGLSPHSKRPGGNPQGKGGGGRVGGGPTPFSRISGGRLRCQRMLWLSCQAGHLIPGPYFTGLS